MGCHHMRDYPAIRPSITVLDRDAGWIGHQTIPLKRNDATKRTTGPLAYGRSGNLCSTFMQ
jgi:hypothetical protein